MNDQSKVSFGKPKATGAVFVAPKGTIVPTNATSALDAAFKGLGYISEDGLVNKVEAKTEQIFAWGGDQVLDGQTTFAEMFTVNLIETNTETLKQYYGASNVVVDGSGNITVKQTSQELPEVIVVFELVMTGGRIKRIVVPKGRITDRSAEIKYVDKEAITYPTTFNAFPDSTGATHSEYIAVVSS